MKVICPNCQIKFDPHTLERSQTGSCWDDEFYCDQCIDDNLCGCKKVLRESGQLIE